MFNQKGSLNIKIAIAGGVGLILFLSCLFVMNISYDNQEQRLRADVKDQQRKIEANLDKMWKVISQNVQILDKYSGDFKEIVMSQMTGRYGADGSQAMMQWLKEHNVNLDANMYKKMMNTIESARTSFEREQRILSELAAEHEKLYTTAPSSWFVSGSPVEVKMISSDKTKSIIQSGEENDVDLFKKE